MKNFKFFKSKYPLLTRSSTLPGVPTTIWIKKYDMRRTIFKHIPMSVNRNSSINGLWFDILPVFSQPFEFLVNLVCQFPSVTENECWNRIGVFLQSLQNGNDKNGSFSHSRLGLTQQIVSENGIGNALLLDFRGVFEGGVGDCSVDFGQQ